MTRHRFHHWKFASRVIAGAFVVGAVLGGLSGVARAAADPSIQPSPAFYYAPSVGGGVGGKHQADTLIVKFRNGAGLPDRADDARAVRSLSLPASVASLAQRLQVRSMERVFPGIAWQAARLDRLAKSSPANLPQAERKLAEREARATGRTKAPTLDGIYKVRITPAPGMPLDVAIAAFAKDPNVEYAEPDRVVQVSAFPNDPLFPQQWPLHNTGQAYPYSGSYGVPPGTADKDVDAPEAWDATTGSQSLIIAVNDTGVDYNHRDLVQNMWQNPVEVAGVPGVDDDGNGYVDDVRGMDLCSYTQSPDTDPMDDNGHGTHCAGIIGARGNNGLDITGVCWAVSIMPIKTFASDGYGYDSDGAAGIVYAANNGADIVSNSWGGYYSSSTVQQAVEYAEAHGVLVVAAAGNDGSADESYPAAYPSVVAVAASNSKDQRASFSNCGYWVDVTAPGVDILSLRAAGTSRGAVQSSYTTVLSGTSMACPLVAGIAGLGVVTHPSYNLDEIRALLKMATDNHAPTVYMGQGRVNADAVADCLTTPPVAILSMQGQRAKDGSVGGTIPISGTARGSSLDRYELSYGAGMVAVAMTPSTSGTATVVGGLLAPAFDTVPMWEGLFSVRLTAYDNLGRRVETEECINVENFIPILPMNNDILRPGPVSIRATIRAAVTSMTIEQSTGWMSPSWTTAGIVTSGGAGNIWGTWDTASITTPTFKNLRFTFNTTAGPRTQYVDMIHFDPRLKPGFPAYEPYEADSIVHENMQDVVVADLNNDGHKELVTIHVDVDHPSGVSCYSDTGQLLWRRFVTNQPFGTDIPCVGDLDGDGDKEVLFAIGSPTYLQALNGDGSDVGGNWPLALPTGRWGISLADLDRNGVNEVVMASEGGVQTGSSSFGRILQVVSSTGVVLMQVTTPMEGWGIDPQSFPTVGNFDSDSDLEIACHYGGGNVAVFNRDGSMLPGWPRATNSERMSGSMPAGDMDSDGLDELVYTPFDSSGNPCPGVLAFNHDGTAMPGWPVIQGADVGWFVFNAALANLDGDPRLETVFPAGNRLFAFDDNGTTLPGFPVKPSLTAFRNAAIGDVDGDGAPDIVLANGGLTPSVQSAGNVQFSGGIEAWHADGSQIDLSPEPNSKAMFMELGSHISLWKAPPTLTDLDGDGQLDIVASAVAESGIGSSRTKFRFKKRNGIYAWSMGVPYNAASMQWPAFQKGPEHNGHYTYPTVTGVGDWSLY